ncbi:MAG: hypothetical protein NTZ49_02085 [Candidatus Parcubacteria bacterium]|nr:hypothetical protein [Candidatus Parcubacteria bacterium]
MAKDFNLTNEEIRQLLLDGNSCAEIAKAFGVPLQRVSGVKGNMVRKEKPRSQAQVSG